MPGIQRFGIHADLAERYGKPRADALWSATTAAILIGVMALLALVIGPAFLFVSLGPIIYELIERPLAPASAPRNVILGNGLALLVAYIVLGLCGLQHEPSSFAEGVTPMRILAAMLALGIIGALLASLDAMHPPAGATGLFVALGFARAPSQIVTTFAGVLVITLLGWVLNRAADVPVPRWRPTHAT